MGNGNKLHYHIEWNKSNRPLVLLINDVSHSVFVIVLIKIGYKMFPSIDRKK